MTDIPKIPAPAERALANVDVREVENLEKFTEEELLTLHGIGPKALRILKKALVERNLHFRKN